MPAVPSSPRPTSTLTAVALAVSMLVAPVVAQAQDNAGEMPSIETLEAQFEQMFTAAVAATDEGQIEPMHVLMGWGVVMMSATVLDVRRAQLEGRAPDSERVQEALLERWSAARPDSAGPELFRIFQIHDHAERVPGLLALAARHPDDSLVLSQVGQTLRSLGRAGEVTELLEAHAARQPNDRMAWQMLAEHYGSLDDKTREAATLGRWAEVAPDDPALVDRWVAAGLDRIEPEATDRLLARFLGHRHDDPRALQPCARLARIESSPHRAAAQRCVARFAALSGDDEASAQTRDRAIGLLAELAAEAIDEWLAPRSAPPPRAARSSSSRSEH